MALITENEASLSLPPLQTQHKIYFDDARNIKKLPKESVHLIITSPPYWSIKNYSGDPRQIGYNDELNKYIDNLVEVFKACYDALKPGCRMCIDIGDQFLPKTETTPYQIIPIHARLVNVLGLRISGLNYLGSIYWNKVTTSNTSGGGKVMGSVYQPRNGYFFINREHIAVFKKSGKDPKPLKEYKEASKFTIEERRMWFSDDWSWNFPGVKQQNHIAMFPEELPYRLIRMYSFIGDTILDPFAGSGTTNRVAAKIGRNSIGIELGFDTKDGSDWKTLIKEKVSSAAFELDSSLPFLTTPKFIFKDGI